MSGKIDFSEIQTLASLLNKLHLTVQEFTATITYYEYFTKDEVEDINDLFHKENFTCQEIAKIYGSDSIKVKKVINVKSIKVTKNECTESNSE